MVSLNVVVGNSMLHIILIWLPERVQVQCPDFLHGDRYFMLGAKYITIVNMKRKRIF